MLSLIVAIGKNNVIGKGNKLIWHLPNDLKRFKKITKGKTIIMGRKTFESLGRILPDRRHVIISKSNEIDFKDERIEIITNIEDIDKYVKDKNENFVIGGASIYKLLLNKVNKMYITKINEEFDGDAYFPEFDETEWNIIEIEKGVCDENNPYDYEYITYVRK